MAKAKRRKLNFVETNIYRRSWNRSNVRKKIIEGRARKWIICRHPLPSPPDCPGQVPRSRTQLLRPGRLRAEGSRLLFDYRIMAAPGNDSPFAYFPCFFLSWKVRYRTFPWFFSQMSKLYRARSLLYRRQILQVNIRWKALDVIYKIYMLLHRSDLNISEFFVKLFRIFSAEFCQNSLFLNSFHWFLLRFWWNLSEFRR